MFNRISEHFDNSDMPSDDNGAPTVEQIEDTYVERMHVLLDGAADYSTRVISESDSLAADINRVLAERIMNAADTMTHRELVIIGLAASAVRQLMNQ